METVKMTPGITKSGRVRKKSAKVLEMEAAEELEKKAGDKLGASAKKPRQKTSVETVVITSNESSVVVHGTPESASVIKHLLNAPSPEKTGIPVFRASPVTETPDVVPSKKTKSGKKSDKSNADSLNPLSTTVDLLRNRLGKNTADGEDLKLRLSLGAIATIGSKDDEKGKKEKSSKKKIKDSASAPPIGYGSPEMAGNLTVKSESDGGLKLKLIVSPKESTPSSDQGTEVPIESSLKRKKSKDGNGSSSKKIKIKKEIESSPAFSHGMMEGTELASTKVKKKKKRDPSEKGRHPVACQKWKVPRDSTHLTAVNHIKSPPLDNLDSDLEDEPSLVIAEEVKVKSKKIKVKKDKSVKITTEIPSPVKGTAGEMEKEMMPDINTEASPVDASAEPVYMYTHEMAMKLQTSSEKKMNKKSRRKKGDPEKPKRRRGLTAYMMWCNSYRNRVISENPGIDFAQISKRLGEIWQSLPSKDKINWKRKAKRFNARGPNIISTGKTGKTSTLTKSGQSKPTAEAAPSVQPASGKVTSPPAEKVVKASSSVDSTTKCAPQTATGTSALDVAAHLKLLGESLSIIGARLQEHQGQIAVQGSLSVLLDSLLCTLGPLSCMTAYIPELDGCPQQTHSNTLDSIAYIMPGL